MTRLAVGDMAPAFSLKSQTGDVFDLRDLMGRKEVVLYFYPKDNTPGCTAEAKAFRDHYTAFKEMGAEVIGVSSDSVDSHSRFSQSCSLPFTILSDDGGKVRKLYGVPSTLGLFPGRVTYVIGRDGIIRHVFNSQTNPAKHVEEAMGIIASMKGERAGSSSTAGATQR